MKKLPQVMIAFVLMIAAYYAYQYLYQVNKPINKEISVDQLDDTRMSKAVYSYEPTPNITFVDIELTDEQINNIIGWINAVPKSSIVELNQIPSNISAGIVFGLHSRKEIRVQYDLEKIYVTRTDVKNKQVKYAIVQDDLKAFFDEQLKGFYFGKDKVN